MAKRKIRLQPIHGKCVMTRVNNHDVNIWLVDPKTNQQGTDVAYDDAIAILAFNHPVATPAQIKGKDGKFIQQLTDEDRAAIQERKENYGVETPAAAPTSDNAAYAELIKTQGELIKTQTELMKTMKAEIDELKKDHAKPAKAKSKDKDKE